MSSTAEKRQPVANDKSKVPLAEILGALSFALDLTEGQPQGHSMRCCWIGIHIGRELNFAKEQLWQLYYTLLLKDIGCSSNAARICQLFLTDDRIFKRNHKTMALGSPSALKFVLEHSGLKAPLHKRFQTAIKAVINTGEYSTELIETRCHAGADIARKLRFPEPVAKGIQSLDEHWNGKGLPAGQKGEEIPLFSRIALLAQVTDVFHTASDAAGAINEVKSRENAWFDPKIVEAFLTVSKQKEFWEGLKSPHLAKAVRKMEPSEFKIDVDDDYLDEIAEAFALVIDAKSPFTAGHSHRVRLYTHLIAKELGLPETDIRSLVRAALLHDIGKLAISNSVLDKPGKLDEDEWTEIRRHPEYSKMILSKVSIFGDIAEIAGAHHERPDGQGYPEKLRGEQICLNTRIVSVADVFDALTSDRPYWKAKSPDAALELMRNDVGTAFDETCLKALEAALQKVNKHKDMT